MQADTHSASCRNVWSIWQELHCHSETSSYGRYNALKPFLPCGVDHVAMRNRRLKALERQVAAK